MPIGIPEKIAPHMVQYYDRVNAAEASLQQALKTASLPLGLIEEIRDAVKKTLRDKYEAVIESVDGDVLEAMDDDELGFDVGRTAAEAFAQEKGITDTVVLEKIREFGFHVAALWNQSITEAEYARQERENHLVPGDPRRERGVDDDRDLD